MKVLLDYLNLFDLCKKYFSFEFHSFHSTDLGTLGALTEFCRSLDDTNAVTYDLNIVWKHAIFKALQPYVENNLIIVDKRSSTKNQLSVPKWIIGIQNYVTFEEFIEKTQSYSEKRYFLNRVLLSKELDENRFLEVESDVEAEQDKMYGEGWREK